MGIEIVHPRGSPAQGEDAVLHRKGFVAAQAEFESRRRAVMKFLPTLRRRLAAIIIDVGMSIANLTDQAAVFSASSSL
jgi:hypothetical protein